MGPILITDLSLSANNPNNPTHTAGTTFFGQFVDHDITFDTTSTLGVTTDPGVSKNSRTPSLDLDSVYGEGPVASPQLYDPSDHDKLRIGFGGLFEDLARVDDGTNTAIIPDPRNDENMMIAGLQCAFILFHNHAVDWARDHGYKGGSTFPTARQLTTWHYHWLVLHEFLPQIVGQSMVDDVLRNGRRFYKPRMREGFIPVEFQTGGDCVDPANGKKYHARVDDEQGLITFRRLCLLSRRRGLSGGARTAHRHGRPGSPP